MVNFTEEMLGKKGAFLSGVVAFLMFLDLYQDSKDGAPLIHVFIECAIFIASICIFFIVARQLYLGRKKQKHLLESLERLKESKAQIRAEMKTHLSGLSQVIEKQFKAWSFTLAEREVGLLLLKGISLKEIASFRGCAEKTVHSQVQSIYKKSGLRSRSEFSAFFLEDLLNPIQFSDTTIDGSPIFPHDVKN